MLNFRNKEDSEVRVQVSIKKLLYDNRIPAKTTAVKPWINFFSSPNKMRDLLKQALTRALSAYVYEYYCSSS